MWFQKASTFADSVGLAFNFTMAVSFFFLIAITLFMIYSIYRYYHKRNPKPSNVEGSVALEVVWTVIPTVLVLLMFYFGFLAYKDIRAIPKDALKVKVIAGKWYWRFQYPNGVELSDKEGLKVPLNKPVVLELHSKDVVHSFFVPAFRVKLDAMPVPEGRAPNTMWFQATKTGNFEIFCAEYCGLDHSRMLSKVVVVEPNEFDSWYQKTGAEAAQATQKLPGEKLYTEKGCFACHSIDGSKKVGPTFKGLFGKTEHVTTGGSKRKITADETYLKKSILEPAADIVEGFPPAMPPQNLTEKEVKDLIEYIKSLK